jgi:hypothetical protein
MTVAKDAANNAGKTGFYMRPVTPPGCALALLLFAGAAMAQHPQASALHATAIEAATVPTALDKHPAATPSISYVGGQLRINVFNATLADVLTQVAVLTGVIIEVPPGARNERMPVVELGPGTARQVLASLLSDSTFDYLIQSSSADPEKLQSVLLIPRDKKGSAPAGADASGRPARSPYLRAEAQPEAPVPDNPPPPQPQTAPEASALSSVPPAVQPDPSAPPTSPQPDQSVLLPSTQQDPSASPRPGALAPPQTLNPQSINQQLQQMYQQRMQMAQPASQTLQPVVKQ